MEVSRQIEILRRFITDHRRQLIAEVLSNRTQHLTVVLEDIYQAQNASAVLRTCECFGIQDVHIIENENTYRLNPRVVMGSSKWLSLHHYNAQQSNTQICLEVLRQSGYRILGTSVSPSAKPIEACDITHKSALVFGTELTGISEVVESEADELVTIPMYGFTESFNLSVSAAIVVSQWIQRLRKSSVQWQLDESTRQNIELDWLRDMVRRASLILTEAEG